MNDPVIKVTGRTLQLSESVRRLNPDLGAVAQPEPKQPAPRSLEQGQQKLQGGKVSVVVSLIRFGSRDLDSDNLAASFKPLRDAIAYTLGVDDGDPRVRWQYGQTETRGEHGALVRVELI